MSTSFQEHFEVGGADQQSVGTTETALPSHRAKMVNIKANNDNSGNVFVGLAGVLTTDGFELDAGQETGWLPIADTSDIALIADAASQGVSFIWLT